jgi:DNA repair exonuclease SbcCD ATPase subunit
MLNFDKLILHNFGSYGHTELDLHNKGFCLVSGRNEYEKDNAISNGSGKSFLWSAICFALCGETINGLHTNLKNINVVDDPACWVQLTFTEKSDHYDITRHITPRSDLKILKNGTEVSGKGIRESEKKLSELLPDLTKNLITSTIIIGQGMPNKFSSFSPSGRKELLEKLTKADFMIEDIKQRVGNRQSTLATQLRGLEDAVLASQSQIRVHEATLRQRQQQLGTMIKPDFDSQIESKASEVSQYANQRAAIDSQIVGEERAAAESAEKQVQAIAERAAELEAIRKSSETVRLTLVQEKHKCQADLNAVNKEISTLSNIKDTCPTCGQKIPGCHKPDLTEQYQRLSSLQEQLKQLTTQSSEHEASYTKAVQELGVKHDENIARLTQEANARRDYTAQLRSSVRSLATAEATAREQLTRLNYEKETWDARYAAIQSDILEAQTAITSLTARLDDLNAQLTFVSERLKVVKKMDTLLKREFRGYLLTNIIQYINQKAKDYCNIVFGTRDLDIYLDGNDLNISYCGKMFDNLSGGEKQRVDLILQFAIRNMLSAYLSFSSNILVLDEITDFLDKKSCAAILNLITRELNTIESVFIISHHASALALPIDSELVIKKNELGISEIISGV